MDIGRWRIKIRLNKTDSTSPYMQSESRHGDWEVFIVNGESLTLPIELGDWLTQHAGEMASLVVEPVL